METKNLGYSVKNIPISNKAVYQKTLIGQTESFLRRLRWKVYHFLSSSENNNNKENFGFRTTKSPPKNQLLYPFENDIYDMIKNIEFEQVRTEFQKKMSSDLSSIRKTKKIFVAADKTRNMYGISPQEYKKMLKDNVTKTYKKSNTEAVNAVNSEACSITEKLNLSDRVQCIAPNEAFVSIKDHKPNFPNNILCRLLNPCKSEIGKISKKYLEEMNNSLRNGLNINQWRNSNSVIDWFKAIQDKKSCKFIKFDIVSFYPSISKSVLMNAINFSKEYHDVTDEMIDTILNSRKSFLYFEGNPWMKKNAIEHFDVTEGSFDGAEVCEIVGLFLLKLWV